MATSSCWCCPGFAEDEAREAAARLQATVAAALGDGELEASLTASVGMARWHEPLTGPELLDRADRALLVAKGSGKDRDVVAGLDTESELARIGAGGGTHPARC